MLLRRVAGQSPSIRFIFFSLVLVLIPDVECAQVIDQQVLTGRAPELLAVLDASDDDAGDEPYEGKTQLVTDAAWASPFVVTLTGSWCLALRELSASLAVLGVSQRVPRGPPSKEPRTTSPLNCIQSSRPRRDPFLGDVRKDSRHSPPQPCHRRRVSDDVARRAPR
jgi:hypothetical protein